jgi:hypothetical protein
MSLEVGYVGNNADNLSPVQDYNQFDPKSPGELAVGSCGTTHCELPADRPFYNQYPYLAFINMLTNAGRSNYDGLQTTFNWRNYHGMSLTAGYTYSHALGDADLSILGAEPQDSRNFPSEYANSSFDIRHRFTLSTTYNIPGIKAPGQLLEGWTINSIVQLQTGPPWGVADGSNDLSRTGESEDRWNFSGNASDFRQPTGVQPIIPCFGFGGPPQGCAAAIPAACSNYAVKLDGGPGGPTSASLTNFGLGCYMVNGSVIIPPAVGTFGNMPRNLFRGPGFHNWDLSVFKSFKFRERLSAQFRVEFFNILNHPNFNTAGNSDPTGAGVCGFGTSCNTPDVAATNPVLGSGGSREMQLGLKLIF